MAAFQEKKMIAPSGDSKICIRFMPSLFHLSLVKVAVPFFSDFTVETLDKAFAEIQHGNSSPFNGGNHENWANYTRAKENLLLIPAHLRKRVMEAIMGLYYNASKFHTEHSEIPKLNQRCFSYYWRPDGSLDRNKTVQQLILNEDIDLVSRFKIACTYCLEQSIQILWAELVASRRTEEIEMEGKCMTHFWATRIRDGLQVPLHQALPDYFELPFTLDSHVPRLSTFLPFLQPEGRKKFLDSLQFAKSDDLRCCLYIITKEEEKQVMETAALRILCLYLEWPLQNLFLETVDKMLNFIDAETFQFALNMILVMNEYQVYYDYLKLFGSFLNMGSDILKNM